MMEIEAPQSTNATTPPIQQPATTLPCPECNTPVDVKSYFCSNCGRKIHEPPPSLSLSKQIGIYLFALLIPPFGIIPAIKYLRSPDHHAKVVGYFTLLITFISLLTSIWLTVGLIDRLNKTVNSQQIQEIQNIGI